MHAPCRQHDHTVLDFPRVGVVPHGVAPEGGTHTPTVLPRPRGSSSGPAMTTTSPWGPPLPAERRLVSRSSSLGDRVTNDKNGELQDAAGCLPHVRMVVASAPAWSWPESWLMILLFYLLLLSSSSCACQRFVVVCGGPTMRLCFIRIDELKKESKHILETRFEDPDKHVWTRADFSNESIEGRDRRNDHVATDWRLVAATAAAWSSESY
jgi:hypothetical protein